MVAYFACGSWCGSPTRHCLLSSAVSVGAVCRIACIVTTDFALHCLLKCLELEKAFHYRVYCYKEIVRRSKDSLKFGELRISENGAQLSAFENSNLRFVSTIYLPLSLKFNRRLSLIIYQSIHFSAENLSAVLERPKSGDGSVRKSEKL